MDATTARQTYAALRLDVLKLKKGLSCKSFDATAKSIVDDMAAERKATEIKPEWWVVAAQALLADAVYDQKNPRYDAGLSAYEMAA